MSAWATEAVPAGSEALQELLREGWEPFAVVQPSSHTTAMVYVRSKVDAEYYGQAATAVPNVPDGSFAGGRQGCLRVVGLLGVRQCSYTNPAGGIDDWLRTRCDCKYGAHSLAGEGGTEQNGCPELRTLYRMLDRMSDATFGTFWVGNRGSL